MIHRTPAGDRGSSWRKPHLPALPDLPCSQRWLSHNTSGGRAGREDADGGVITERVFAGLRLDEGGWGRETRKNAWNVQGAGADEGEPGDRPGEDVIGHPTERAPNELLGG